MLPNHVLSRSLFVAIFLDWRVREAGATTEQGWLLWREAKLVLSSGAPKQLCEDAAQRPDVNLGGILPFLKYDLWRPVVTSRHFDGKLARALRPALLILVQPLNDRLTVFKRAL